MASRDELQTLRRGLQALAILNTEGPSNVATIARRLNVPRANAHRIINTLTAEHYCRKIPNSHLYIADIDNSELLSTSSLPGLITALSIDIIEDLGKQTKWPLALSMAEGPNMISRLATHLPNPLALAKIAPGHVQPMLEAATGIVYLAGVDEQARKTALGDISVTHPAAFAVWEPHFSRVFATVRWEGYFIMRRTGPEASLGVPIMIDGKPIAGIAMRYMKSCVSRATAVDVHPPRLREAANSIASALSGALHRKHKPIVERGTLTPVDDDWSRPALMGAMLAPAEPSTPAVQSLG
jgi:DNA-binding IclR family transcriptional regulator